MYERKSFRIFRFRSKNLSTNGGKEKEPVHLKRRIPRQTHWVSPMSVAYSSYCSVQSHQLIVILSFCFFFHSYPGGVVLSLFVAILEFLWHARKNHANRQVSFTTRPNYNSRGRLKLSVRCIDR